MSSNTHHGTQGRKDKRNKLQGTWGLGVSEKNSLKRDTGDRRFVGMEIVVREVEKEGSKEQIPYGAQK